MKKWSFYKNIAAKTTVLLLTVAIIAPSIFAVIPPKKAEAAQTTCFGVFMTTFGITEALETANKALGVPVSNSGASDSNAQTSGQSRSQFIKDCVEKPLAIAIAKEILARMTDSLVTWINGGFEGQPAFISDPENYFLNIADNLAGQVILDSEDFAFLCSPFKVQVQLALALNYNYSSSYSQQASCTLSDVFNNVDNAFSDFSVGGWDGWFSISQNSSNNPFGAFIDGASHVGVTINNKQSLELAKLNWNGGFLNYETCYIENGSYKSEPYNKFGGSMTGNVAGINFSGGQVSTQGAPANENDFFGQEHCETSTPGKTISGALDGNIKVMYDQVGLADDLDKIWNALQDQLMGKIFGSGGLISLGGAAGSSRENSYVSNYYNDSRDNTGDALDETNGNIDDSNNTGNNSGNTSTTQAANIAQGKKVFSSGTTFDDDATYEASNITDGITKSSNGNNTFNGAITRTLPTDQQPETYGYLMIDLGSTFKQINQIDVYERANPTDNDFEAPTSQKLQYVIQVLDKNQNVVWDSGKIRTDFTGPRPNKITVPVDGQYVRLLATSKGRFQIAEVQVFQNQQPVITLAGGPVYTVTQGTSYSEPGYTAADTEDGVLTNSVKVTGSVDASKVGSYPITYTVTDSQGGVGQATRTVVVQQAYTTN